MKKCRKYDMPGTPFISIILPRCMASNRALSMLIISEDFDNGWSALDKRKTKKIIPISHRALTPSE